VTLFKDVIDATGKTSFTNSSVKFSADSRIIYLGTATERPELGSSENSETNSPGALVLVRSNGDIVGLDSHDLAEKWAMSCFNLAQDILPDKLSELRVAYATLISTKDIIQDSLDVKDGPSTMFSEKIRSGSLSSECLALVVDNNTKADGRRYVLIVGIKLEGESLETDTQRLVQLYAAPLAPCRGRQDDTKVYQFESESRRLFELHDGTIYTYQLHGAVAQLQHSLRAPNACSLRRLSSHSIVTTTATSINIFNPQYRSVSASSTIDTAELRITPADSQYNPPCYILSFFKRLNMLVLLIENSLVAAQVEPPVSRRLKRHAEGLLIDSIGRGLPQDIRAPKKTKVDVESATFSTLLPGSLTGAYSRRLVSTMEGADNLLKEGNLGEFEELLAAEFGMAIETKTGQPNGVHPSADQDVETPDWIWLESPTGYPPVDRRWVLYAISRAFSVEARDLDNSDLTLKVELPSSNVVIYLVVAGHLTLSNIKSAFREELSYCEMTDGLETRLAEELLESLAEVDPTMDLLLNYLSATQLGEKELLLVMRMILRSLDLIQDSKSSTAKLLTERDHKADDDERDITMQLDKLEQELQVMEYHLGDDSSSQARGLTLACAMLGRCPSFATIKAMRLIFQPHEVLSLIYLLRMELVRGGWTAKYIDPTGVDDEDGVEPSPDGTLLLIADLVARCLDALGLRGWLQNDSFNHGSYGDAGSILTALRLEVSAALEGTEEADRLNGFLADMVRFGKAGAPISSQLNLMTKGNKPVQMRLEKADGPRLPLGLKTWPQRIESTKVVSGGEVVQRTKRERGHLISQKVEAYSLERLGL
jgi:hypothetical protein